ncbi:cytochrome P450 4d8-like isoform X1 [Cydia pomonella]|uniref:cytochrome P450 4d8-like isoform X1 n=1 Tax=Cydia pomonella TaxID=82600 RepID=UPI002ADE712B|nr:cytochrome P450 4d8-like isoform X1 [Cydia pomonella]
MFWLLIVLIVCVYFVRYKQKMKKFEELSKKLPGELLSLPVVGHAHYLAGSDEDNMKVLQRAGRIAVKRDGLATFWMAHKLYLIVADPVVAELLLKSHLEKDSTMEILQFLVGNGSIYAPVSIWRPRRKILAPTFNIKKLNRFVDVFASQSALMVNKLRPLAGKGTFPVWKFLTSYTFHSVCETTLGVHTNADDGKMFIEPFEEVVEQMTWRMLQPWLHPDWIYRLFPQYKQADKCRRAMYQFVDKIVKLKRQEMEEKQREVGFAPKPEPTSLSSLSNYEFDIATRREAYYTVPNVTKPVGRVLEPDLKKSQSVKLCDSYLGFQSLLEMLLETSLKVKGFTDLELREEALVMSAAGTDTSAVAASFALVMLARNPEVQEKVFEELNDVLYCPDKAVTAADLPKLKYLEAVVKETLRLYPPVPIIVRTVTSDTELPSGVTVPAGTGICMHIWATHRNPRYWGPDVDSFRPERFLEPLKHPAQFVPFSFGVRNCLGYQYAMMSLKTVLATVLKEYRVLPPAEADLKTLNEPIRVKYDIMMKAVDMFQIQLEVRSPTNSRNIG